MKVTFQRPGIRDRFEKVWFNIVGHYGRIMSLEEHDNYSGGPMLKPKDMTWFNYAVSRAEARCRAGEQMRDFLMVNGFVE